MDGFEALAIANAEFEQRLRLITADDWSRATPCTEWDVHDLVNHVIGGNVRHAMLLRGASAAEVDAKRSEDHLGGDPVAAFASTAQLLLTEFRTAGALSRQVKHPIGDRSGEELLGMRIFDVTVHAWDLACAIEADRMLEPMLVQRTLLELTGRRP